MKVQENFSLKELTTMRVGGKAKYFTQVANMDELKEALAFAKSEKKAIFMIGGGSNIVVSDRGFDGLVIQLRNKGREIIEETDATIRIKVAAGEVLDQVIKWVVENGWCGMENLSFVPGNVAGLVIQNVNAYGHDASRIVESADVIETASRKIHVMGDTDCRFGYRRSRFNQEDKGKYIITAVTLRLHKKCQPVLTYPDVKKWFDGYEHAGITAKEISEAITAIRKNKGQDPAVTWSAGSFFKNLLLTEDEFQTLCEKIKKTYGDHWVQQLSELRDRFARIETMYTSQTGVKELDRGAKIKLPIAFIMDKILNLKGLRVGGAQLSEKQVINIVNSGNATADDVMRLFKKVRQRVYDATGIEVVNEPELIGFTDRQLRNYFELK